MSKKIKVEPEEAPQNKLTPTMKLLSTKTSKSTPIQVQNSSIQFKKTDINSFIKKKSDALDSNLKEKSTQNTLCTNTAEKSTSLLNLMSSYGSDSDSDKND